AGAQHGEGLPRARNGAGFDGDHALFFVPLVWLTELPPGLERGVKVILAHRIELDPTEKQKEYFRQACGTARFVWNWALEEWNYRYDLGANTDACEIKRYFNSFKYEAFPWLKNIHRDAHAQPFAVLSTGRKVEAPKPLGRGLERLRRLSRAHSRKRRGSHNRQKAALRLARCHRRIANMRRDFLHKFTTKISKNHAEIFVENLNVKGMVQNRHLSRAIHDVGWSELRRQLEYKSLLNGSVLTVRDPF